MLLGNVSPDEVRPAPADQGSEHPPGCVPRMRGLTTTSKDRQSSDQVTAVELLFRITARAPYGAQVGRLLIVGFVRRLDRLMPAR